MANVKQNAIDKKRGLTLDELGEFVQAAHRAGVSGSAEVKVVNGFRQQIQTIETRG